MKLDWRSLAKSSQTCTSLRCIRQCPMHRLVKQQTCYSRESATAPWLKITGLSGGAPDCLVSQQRLRQRSTTRSAGDAWPEPTVTRPHRTVSGAPMGPKAQWSASPEEERNRALFMSDGALDCPVRQPTEGKNFLPNGDPTALSCLGAIKGTPRRMEQNNQASIEHLKMPRLCKHAFESS
jgi:hypothetical protein